MSAVPSGGADADRDRHAHAHGLLDTSVVIALERLSSTDLPAESSVAAVTLAELAAGPHAARDAAERARRQDRLQRVEAAFDPLPFDAAAARAYGLVFSAYRASGRRGRSRLADLLIAATALAYGLPVYTANPDAFAGLSEALPVVAVPVAA